VQDVIRNLPDASGYTDSRGMFAPRKAIMQYSQEKRIPGVTSTTSSSATAHPNSS
jgi:alanine-synthesizing transaminase